MILEGKTFENVAIHKILEEDFPKKQLNSVKKFENDFFVINKISHQVSESRFFK